MSIVNGTMSTQRGLTIVWTLRAQKLGTFTIGPPKVTIGGQRYQGQSLSVRVVPAGQAPPRQVPQRNTFDPFGGLFGQLPQIQFPGFRAAGRNNRRHRSSTPASSSTRRAGRSRFSTP